MKRKLRINMLGLETVYAFRGPKSHRPVEVFVRHGYYARFREEKALKEANEKFLRDWVGKAMEIGRVSRA